MDAPPGGRARVPEVAGAVLEERRIPQTKMEPSSFDLVQVDENLEGSGAFLRDEDLDAGEKLAVGETAQDRPTRRHGGIRGTWETRMTRKTRGAREPDARHGEPPEQNAATSKSGLMTR